MDENESLAAIFVEHLEKLDALADAYGIKSVDPAGRFFLLAYKLALEYVPQFASPPRPKGSRGRPRFKTDEYRQALALAAVAAKEKGLSISRMAHLVAEEEKGKSVKARPAVKAAKRQIENDAAKLPVAYRTLATFVTRNLRAGLSVEDIRSKLDAMAAGDKAIEAEAAAIIGDIMSRRHK